MAPAAPRTENVAGAMVAPPPHPSPETGEGTSERGRGATFMMTRRRQSTFVFLLALSVLAGLWSLASGVGALAVWQAGLIGAAAQRAGASAGGAAERDLRRLLARARLLEPANPQHPEQLAGFLVDLAGRSTPRSAARRSLLEEARALYRQSAAWRPTWPYTLTAALQTDSWLGRFGPEFARCYVRAAEIGRAETVSRHALAGLGLAAWPVLAPPTRALVSSLLRLDLALDPRWVLEQALRQGRGAVVEPLIAGDPQLQRQYADLRARLGPHQ